MIPLLVLVSVVAGIVTLFRLAPPPARHDVGVRLRAGGWLVAAAGSAALVFTAVALAGTGENGVVYFLFLQTVTLPPVVAALACLRSGWRLAHNTPVSRITAAIASGLLALTAGFWTWFWHQFEPGSSWVIGSRMAIRVGTGLVAAVGLMALVGFALVVAPLAGRAGPPASRRRQLQRWEVASAIILAAIVATLTVAISATGTTSVAASSGSADSDSGSAYCTALPRLASQPLGALDHGSPEPPQVAGATVVGAVLTRAGHTGDLVRRDEITTMFNSNPAVVVLERLRHKGAARLEAPAREAIRRAGYSAATGTNSGSINGRVVHLDVPYSGQGVSGSVSYAECGGKPYAVVSQEVRPDRIGICHEPGYTAACAAMYDGARKAVSLLTDAPGVDGTERGDPSFKLDGNRVVMSAFVTTSTPLFFVARDVEDAFAGWRLIARTCDKGACFADSLDSADTGAHVSYRRGSVTATIDVTVLGRMGDTLLQLTVTSTG